MLLQTVMGHPFCPGTAIVALASEAGCILKRLCISACFGAGPGAWREGGGGSGACPHTAGVPAAAGGRRTAGVHRRRARDPGTAGQVQWGWHRID